MTITLTLLAACLASVAPVHVLQRWTTLAAAILALGAGLTASLHGDFPRALTFLLLGAAGWSLAAASTEQESDSRGVLVTHLPAAALLWVVYFVSFSGETGARVVAGDLQLALFALTLVGAGFLLQRIAALDARATGIGLVVGALFGGLHSVTDLTEGFAFPLVAEDGGPLKFLLTGAPGGAADAVSARTVSARLLSPLLALLFLLIAGLLSWAVPALRHAGKILALCSGLSFVVLCMLMTLRGFGLPTSASIVERANRYGEGVQIYPSLDMFAWSPSHIAGVLAIVLCTTLLLSTSRTLDTHRDNFWLRTSLLVILGLLQLVASTLYGSGLPGQSGVVFGWLALGAGALALRVVAGPVREATIFSFIYAASLGALYASAGALL